MLATIDTAPDTAYICITSPLYMYTLMSVIGQPTSMVIQNAINNILDNGLDPNIDIPFSNDITHLIIPLNLTGTHWIFVHVRNIDPVRHHHRTNTKRQWSAILIARVPQIQVEAVARILV
jgi:hypothetical protein